MLLYHGSNSLIMRPLIEFSRDRLDFGCGFYMTSFKNQAVSWAKRRVVFDGSVPTISVFEFDYGKAGVFKVKKFDSYDSDWLEFVCANRRGGLTDRFDLIVGPVADDRVFQAVNMYFQGYWNRDRTLEELRFYKKNDQYCFTTQKIIDSCLTFKEGVVVADD
jgi:hypothetical protein